MSHSKYLPYFILLIYFLFSNKNIYANIQISEHFDDNTDTLIEVQINKIRIVGNDRTKEKIILRELAIEKGKIYNKNLLNSLLETSKTNLLKLPLFNYVTIEKLFLTKQLVDIYIIVEERWFTWPEISIINNEKILKL